MCAVRCHELGRRNYVNIFSLPNCIVKPELKKKKVHIRFHQIMRSNFRYNLDDCWSCALAEWVWFRRSSRVVMGLSLQLAEVSVRGEDKISRFPHYTTCATTLLRSIDRSYTHFSQSRKEVRRTLRVISMHFQHFRRSSPLFQFFFQYITRVYMHVSL